MKKPKPLNSYDIVEKAVLEYWDKHHFQEDMVAFFQQKYEHGTDWDFVAEPIFTDGFGSMEFLTDFCEGQTCVKDLTVIPLEQVLRHYAEDHHLGGW